ncbi:hypothetical protein LTR53_006508 [Teratosphaeriaceae sp. CCFEE 6253]|nr:hypothetical protein LTR53_006508 [Teratosphaeriaceae sp. CCFEE 6253]
MDASPFGTLPAEMRNQIYEMVVTQPEAVNLRYDSVCHQFFATAASPDSATTITDDRNMFAITRVCRVFRAESTALVYAVNTFNFQSPPPPHARGLQRDAFIELDKFVSLLPARCARLLKPTLIVDCRLSQIGPLFREFLGDIEKRAREDSMPSLHIHIIYHEDPSEGTLIKRPAPSQPGMTTRIKYAACPRSFDLDLHDVAATRASCDVALARLTAEAKAATAESQESLLCTDLRHHLQNWRRVVCARDVKRMQRR